LLLFCHLITRSLIGICLLVILHKGIHKHYGVQDWCDWSATHKDVLPFVAVSSGTSDADFAKVDAIMDVVDVPFICLDVANGYSEHVRTSSLTPHPMQDMVYESKLFSCTLPKFLLY
jgi:hypothetical protein